MSDTTIPFSSVPFTPDLPTLLSLSLAFSLLPAAQIIAAYSLPTTTPRKLYWLFVWCAFDVLTHSILEGSFLYHCFFSYRTLPAVTSDYPHPASQGLKLAGRIASGPFLGHRDRVYGSWYSDGPMARLWQEYAKADRRWGGADLSIISLELLTVFGAGPLAAWICSLLARAMKEGDVRVKAGLEAKMWWVAVVLSTAELYGGFITFAPEWLSGNEGLATEDPVYLWLYLVFFNVLWVFVPAWILWEAWREMRAAFVRGVGQAQVKKVA